MSLTSSIEKTIEKSISAFVGKVAKKYNLDEKELKCLWDGKTSSEMGKCGKSRKKPPPTSLVDMSIDPDNLLKCTKAELSALCKKHGHFCSGTKSVLIGRLLGKEVKSTPKKRTQKKKAKEEPPVIKKLTANIPNINIRRNKFNNYEHPESKLVFDNASKKVIGKQNDDGSIDELTEEDIDTCNAFKFKYDNPFNLDSKTDLKDVKIGELKDEEEDDEEEEDEEEVELEEEEILIDEPLLDDDLEAEFDEEYLEYE